MEVPRLSRRELAFVIGVPAAWGIMLLFIQSVKAFTRSSRTTSPHG